MVGAGFCNFSFWWLIPLVMIALCFFMMRGRKGSMMCGFGRHDKDSHRINPSDSAMDILDKQYAAGKLDEKEYEKKKIILTQFISHRLHRSEFKRFYRYLEGVLDGCKPDRRWRFMN